MARIGLMGCGAVADFGHLPAIRATEGVECVAVYDPDHRRAELIAERHGIPLFFSDLEGFFDVSYDALSITSPAGTHFENIREAAQRGLHVLCEKPLSLDRAEADAAVRLMDQAGLMMGIGFCYRFSPVALQLRSWVEEGAIGELRAVRMIYVWDLHGQWMQRSDGEWTESPHWVGRMKEGGPLIDCGTHQIDLARWWTGSEVARWHCEGAWVADGYEAPDYMTLAMDHENGVKTFIEVGYSYGHTAREPITLFSYDLIGTGGVARYDRNGWVLELRQGQGTWRVPGASEKSFEGMYRAWADALAAGELGAMPSAREGHRVTVLAMDATAAAIAQRPRVRPALRRA